MNEAEPDLCLPPRPLRNSGGLRLPPGTCDTHFHVFAAGAPLASPRSYTPQIQTIQDWMALARSFNIERGVLVQPSVYGTDNSVLLAALAQAPDRLRGVVVVGRDSTESELHALHRQGVRGIRINLRNKSGVGYEVLKQFAPVIRDLGWHVVFQIGPDAIETVAGLTQQHDVIGIIDHLAFMPLDDLGPARDVLLRALDTGRVYAKISAPYRLRDMPAYAGYRALLSTLTVCYPERLLWGTDWPHTELFETVPEEDDLIALTLSVLTPEVRQAVLVSNPDTLYFRPFDVT